MVVVVMRVDEPPNRGCQLTQIGLELDASPRRHAAVHDEETIVAGDGPNRLVEQRIAADPDTIADLLP
jgi:hypothetical protein